MANRLVCSTRDSGPLAVWTAAPGSIGPWVRGGSQRVLARVDSAAPGAWEVRVLWQPAVIGAGPPRPCLSGGSLWALSCSMLGCVVAGCRAGGGMALALGGRGHPGAQPLSDQRPRLCR